jgi:hypothetical protein
MPLSLYQISRISSNEDALSRVRVVMRAAAFYVRTLPLPAEATPEQTSLYKKQQALAYGIGLYSSHYAVFATEALLQIPAVEAVAEYLCKPPGGEDGNTTEQEEALDIVLKAEMPGVLETLAVLLPEQP